MHRNGYKQTEEHRRKISESNKGRKLSKKHKIKLSNVHKGIKKTKEHKIKIGIGNTGKKRSIDTRMIMSELKKGKRNYFWKGGVTPINLKIRMSLEYKLWRESIFKRDNYTCIWCGDSGGGNLNADHIKPFALFPELRFAIDNGRTLCESCHRKTDTYGIKLKKSIIK